MGWRHLTDPEQYKTGKDRLQQGKHLALGTDRLRPFYCRTCGQQQDGRVIPRGWYSLARHGGEDERLAVRLGIYCSIACLQQQLPRIAGIDARGVLDHPSAMVTQRRTRDWMSPHDAEE